MPVSRTRTRRKTAGRITWIFIDAKNLWMPKVWTQPHVTGTRGSTSLSALSPGSRNGTLRGTTARSQERSEYLQNTASGEPKRICLWSRLTPAEQGLIKDCSKLHLSGWRMR
ncbi:hypothetical protein PO909_017494 [Leuciscus waleckii]